MPLENLLTGLGEIGKSGKSVRVNRGDDVGRHQILSSVHNQFSCRRARVRLGGNPCVRIPIAPADQDGIASGCPRATPAMPGQEPDGHSTFQDLDRGRVTRVDFRHPGVTGIVNQIDPKQTAQAGGGGHGGSDLNDLTGHVVGQSQRSDRSAIAERRSSQSLTADQLAGDAEQTGGLRGSQEDG